jgi:hypothetical protein
VKVDLFEFKPLGSVISFALATLFLLHFKQEIFHSPNRCVFSLKEGDDREQLPEG